MIGLFSAYQLLWEILRSVDLWIRKCVKSRAFLLHQDARFPSPSGATSRTSVSTNTSTLVVEYLNCTDLTFSPYAWKSWKPTPIFTLFCNMQSFGFLARDPCWPRIQISWRMMSVCIVPLLPKQMRERHLCILYLFWCRLRTFYLRQSMQVHGWHKSDFLISTVWRNWTYEFVKLIPCTN